MPSDRIEQAPKLENTREHQLKGLTDLQMHFLHRLESVVGGREEYLARPMSDQDPFEVKLLSRAVYAALTDCMAAGVGEYAQAVIDASRTTEAS